MNRLKYIFLTVVLCVFSLSVAGCGKEKLPQGDTDVVVTKEVTPELTPEVTVTPEPKNPNPLQIEGYQRSEWKDTSQAIQSMAYLPSDAKIGDKFVYDFGVLSYDEKYVLVSYVLAQDYADYMNETNCEKHLVLISTQDLTVVRDVTLEGNYYVNCLQDALAVDVYQSAEDKWMIQTYDYELNPICELRITDNTSGTGICTSDGKRTYYTANKKIFVLNGENQVTKEVTFDGNCLVDYLTGVITDADGNDYVIFWGMASDYQSYQFIVNATTGEVVRVSAMEEGYLEITNNTYMEYFLTDFYPNHWLVGVSKEEAYDFEWKGDALDLIVHTLKNQEKLFSYISDDTMYLFLYDYASGKLVGSTSFDTSWMKDEDYKEEFEAYPAQAYLYETPLWVNEETLFLHFSNTSGEKFFLEWKVGIEGTDAQNMKVTRHEMGSLDSVDLSNLNQHPLYTPGSLSEYLKPLRARADKLEEKYGVNIYIGEESANIVGGYSVEPLTDYNLVEYALDMLEEEMAKYPDNFFSQFSYSWVDGLDISIAGTLTGISEDVLDYAGGFKTMHESRILLVMDCYDSYGVVSTFHHELCHAIEEKIQTASYQQENPLFQDAAWNALNPFEDMYTYTYADYGYPQYSSYRYDESLYGKQQEDAYFIDMYAMTYPTEDRARIFESVMTDHLFDVDFKTAPHLAEKLNYYARCIREVFDTTGWENVPWEAYME